MNGGFRYLSQQNVAELGGADTQEAFNDACDVVTLMRQGETEMPAEIHVTLQGERGKTYALPAKVGGRFNAVGVKWTAHRPDADDGLPQSMPLTLVNRADSGLPLGLVESSALTAARTAAVSAIALRYAAPRKVRRVLLLGAGVQAIAHLEMLGQLFPELECVNWWHRRPQLLINNTPTTLPWPVHEYADLPQAIALENDAILTCTSAAEPLIDADAIRPGRIVIQVGYHEVSFAAINRCSRVVVDLWGDFCESSAKSLFQMYRAGQFSAGRVDADLGNLLLDGWRPAADDSVYFSSFGLNVFDVALAARVLTRATERNVGTLLSLFSASHYDQDKPC
ncbi:ornithine cyclodeaminase [Rouxiella sp. S1S-2]|uniref:ornithine cyclodeaminase family protein n=1 Tax=Rouxiella sp. S1S-2 TaxID=2653856 RepID=UPI001264A30B|nr:ornithine cyclodeaminase family protein [Rouxiella sp. S1S-2]KAB7896689.1 ornithine cyclodeaminase [Rouxiella sp. S1S-2]